jgi:hypothetical protein
MERKMALQSQSSTCDSCVFFEDHASNTQKPEGDAGLCRFNPPVSQPDAKARGLWPVVTTKDWCGHFTAERH